MSLSDFESIGLLILTFNLSFNTLQKIPLYNYMFYSGPNLQDQWDQVHVHD